MKRRPIVEWFPPVLLALCIAPIAAGQIVPNGSFESFTALPTQHSQLVLATPWYSPTEASPDYFHTSGTGTAAVPNNLWGSQLPYDGEAYAGAIAYNSLTEEREYLQAPLNLPLIAGYAYDFEMYVSLADVSGYAIDSFGAAFTAGPVTQTGYTHLPLTPQVANPTNVPLASNLTWMPISGSFVATGGENYITVGNFHNDANTTTYASTGSNIGAIYYVDGVSISEGTPPEPIVDYHVTMDQFSGGGALVFGSPDLPNLPANFFFPGSAEFSGGVAVCDGVDDACGPPMPGAEPGTFGFDEGATPGSFLFDERTSLDLRSMQPIAVGGGAGGDVFFDVLVELDLDATGSGETNVAPGTPGDNFVVDSFFDIAYRIEFIPQGGTPGDASNQELTGNATLNLVTDPLDPLPARIVADPLGQTERLLLGYDGQQYVTMLFDSENGGFSLNLIGVPEPASCALAAMASLTIVTIRRKLRRFPT